MRPAGVVIVRRDRLQPRLAHQLNGDIFADFHKIRFKAGIGPAAIFFVNLAAEETAPETGLLFELTSPEGDMGNFHFYLFTE